MGIIKVLADAPCPPPAVLAAGAGGGVEALLEHTLLLAKMALRSSVALWKARSRSVKRWLGQGSCGRWKYPGPLLPGLVALVSELLMALLSFLESRMGLQWSFLAR